MVMNAHLQERDLESKPELSVSFLCGESSASLFFLETVVSFTNRFSLYCTGRETTNSLSQHFGHYNEEYFIQENTRPQYYGHCQGARNFRAQFHNKTDSHALDGSLNRPWCTFFQTSRKLMDETKFSRPGKHPWFTSELDRIIIVKGGGKSLCPNINSLSPKVASSRPSVH